MPGTERTKETGRMKMGRKMEWGVRSSEQKKADAVESMRSKTNRIPVHFNIYKNAIFDQIME